MAHGSDSHGNQSGNSFLMGLLTGTALGVGLGMLFAPRAGSELRTRLADQAGGLADQAQDGYRKATRNVGEWAEKGKGAAAEWTERAKHTYDKTREAVSQGADEAHEYLRDATAGEIRSSAPGSSVDDSSFFPSGTKGTR